MLLVHEPILLLNSALRALLPIGGELGSSSSSSISIKKLLVSFVDPSCTRAGVDDETLVKAGTG